MKVVFLDGPAVADRLPALVQKSRRLDVAMAFVKMNGLRTLMKSVNTLLVRSGSFRIVFGLSSRYAITDKESAQTLFDLSKHRNVTVRKWNHSGFHPKLLIFHGSPTYIIVGSANLTGSAQSSNAEANILIEDPEPQVLKDAEQFFSYYFDTAPTLKRKDIQKYARHFRRRTETTSYESSDEDAMPSPMQRINELAAMKPNRIWKIAPGKDARYWDEWIQAIDEDGQGVVAIGWSEVGSLNNYRKEEDLKKEVQAKAEEVWDKKSDTRTNVGYATEQLWTFRKGISEGDVFIVYSECRVLGIAKVEGQPKYMYNDSGPIGYAHQMRVKYRWYKQWPHRADQKIIDTLGKRGTLKLVNYDWLWNYLLKTIP